MDLRAICAPVAQIILLRYYQGAPHGKRGRGALAIILPTSLPNVGSEEGGSVQKRWICALFASRVVQIILLRYYQDALGGKRGRGALLRVPDLFAHDNK